MDDNTSFTITDLINLQRIVEAACERGAFKANEMKDIGITYERLQQFIASVNPQPSADQD